MKAFIIIIYFAVVLLQMYRVISLAVKYWPNQQKIIYKLPNQLWHDPECHQMPSLCSCKQNKKSLIEFLAVSSVAGSLNEGAAFLKTLSLEEDKQVGDPFSVHF